MSLLNNYFTEDAHLSEEAIALYVDALRLNKVYLLPSVVLRHVADCRVCKAEIVENSTLLQNQEFRAVEPHPYFDRKVEGSEKRLSYAYRIAAVVIVGINAGYFLFLLRSIRHEQVVGRGSIGAREYVETEGQNPASSDSMKLK